ncbi:sensor domain-containing protein [Breznakiella homolactica]|uniref:EAL domain-containing protein n=1 Tax=Breznakiella homolactica TaxID=2798577 RepID=A0A7T8B7S3_9SPIR|nr:EAL domain-containing protein [Breznakiella homolactica]QQO07819.1 EAL domain-containing protein [Breznakiella homolactica]
MQNETPQNLGYVLDSISAAVLVVNKENGLVEYANGKICQALDKTIHEIQGRHFRHLFLPEFISVYYRILADCEDGREHTVIYYWAEKVAWEQISAMSVNWNGRPAILLTILYVSEFARSEYVLETMNHFDSLLKLPNGAKLEDDINELANFETVALLYFEIEHFEEINDMYGWDNGDFLLMQIRDWLLSSESRRAQIYRVSNGFAILGRHVTMQDAINRSEEILRRFSQPWAQRTAGKTLSLYCTVRLGIVYGHYVKNEMRNILLRTIRSCENSDKGYAIYDEQANQEAKRARKVMGMFISCVLNNMNGFDIHFQPIIDVRTGRWCAAEALCRWTATDGTAVSPMEFIHLAEQLHLIETLDNWVSASAMERCVALGLHQREFILDINFSPTRQVKESFINKLLKTLKDTGFPPEKLNLEITESAKMNFDSANISGLKRLREEGIVLSLDDFGTGYSNFENLIHLSAKALKTEKMFLDGIEHDTYRQYLLKMLTDLAHHLGMSLICEGVETEEQFMLLQKYGIDYAQGYYFSRPLTYDQLRQELNRFV